MQFLRLHRKIIVLLAPLIAFFVLDYLIPHHAQVAHERTRTIDGSGYLYLVAARVVVMITLIAVGWKIYLGDFPFRIDKWGIVTGIVGGLLWIGICELALEQKLLELLGQSKHLLGQRSGVNPFELYNETSSLGSFLVFRFSLLVIAVPVAEELFLRGFLMRAVDTADWQELPLRDIGTSGLVAGTLYGVVSHPSELIAAAVWFTLITVLMLRTGKFWNCVAAHAITNLMLGIYVCLSGNWHLW